MAMQIFRIFNSIYHAVLSIKYHIAIINGLNYNNISRVEMYEPVKEKVEGDNLDALLVQNFAMITPIFTGIAVLLNILIFGKIIFYHVNLVPFILFYFGISILVASVQGSRPR